jgi:ethanolamine utilization protein EutL
VTALVDLWPVLLSCRHIEQVDAQLASAMGLDRARHASVGLVTCDQDDSMYVALDHATKFADVDVTFAKSFYAGSKHASGPFSGEILGIVAGAHPDHVAEALWALREHLRVVRFQTFPGDAVGTTGHPAFLAHVIAETGRYLAPQAGVEPGAPMAYLIAPPAESVIAVDAALKAAPVKLAKWIAPPSETNFGGAFLTGALADLEAARDAFVDAMRDFSSEPMRAARRPDRMRR